MKVSILLALLSAALLAKSGDAQPDRNSANFMLPICQKAIAPNGAEGDPYEVGRCAGMMNALLFFRGGLLPSIFNYCPPESVTVGQMTRVVIAYIERRPQSMHEHFVGLALLALHEAWPCN
jgi:hypothetical protein